MAPFYGWGSTASRLQPLRGDSLLFTTQFPEIPISLSSNIEKILEKLMYRRLYTFLNNKNIIYDLQFRFRQQYSTSHTLINITENIRKTLDDGNIEYK